MKTRSDSRRSGLAWPAVLVSLVAVLVTSPALAHHSFAAFEDVQIRTLEGTVRTFQWTNPHVILTVVAKADGRAQPREWTIVTSGPAILRRFGWRRDSLHTGDRVGMTCNPRRDGSPECRLHTLTLLDSGATLKTKLSGSTDLGPR